MRISTAVAIRLLELHDRPPLDACTYFGLDNGATPRRGLDVGVRAHRCRRSCAFPFPKAPSRCACPSSWTLSRPCCPAAPRRFLTRVSLRPCMQKILVAVDSPALTAWVIPPQAGASCTSAPARSSSLPFEARQSGPLLLPVCQSDVYVLDVSRGRSREQYHLCPASAPACDDPLSPPSVRDQQAAPTSTCRQTLPPSSHCCMPTRLCARQMRPCAAPRASGRGSPTL